MISLQDPDPWKRERQWKRDVMWLPLSIVLWALALWKLAELAGC